MNALTKARKFLELVKRNEEGATAIETAIILPIFFSFTFAFFDMGAVMLRQVTVNGAIDRVARELRIEGNLGVNPNATPDQLMAEFRKRVCDQTFILKNCMNNMIIDMRPVTNAASFPAANAPCAPRGPGGRARPATTYNQSATTEVMLVRICVPSGQLMPGYGIGNYLSDSYGEIMIFSATAFLFETGT